MRRHLSRILKRAAGGVYDPLRQRLKELDRRFPGLLPRPTRRLKVIKPWDLGLLENWLYHRAIALGRQPDYRWEHWPPKDPAPVWESYWEEVADYLRPGMTIVEVGPGYGYYTDRYVADCGRVYLVDYSEVICFLLLPAKYADQPKAIPVHTTDCRIPVVAAGSVDLFFSIACFVHIDLEAHYGYLLEAYRVLKPGGIVVIHFASMLGEASFNYHFETCPPDFVGHLIRCHHPESLELIAKRIGFEVVKTVVEKNLFDSHLHLRK